MTLREQLQMEIQSLTESEAAAVPAFLEQQKHAQARRPWPPSFAGIGRSGQSDLIPADLERMASLVDTYADLPLGSMDASLTALAERLAITDIATLDQRHFTVVRPQHVAVFTLLPA